MSKQIKHPLLVTPNGYGHWHVATRYRGELIGTITTNSMAIDDWNSEEDEKDGRQLRKLRGYNALRSECIRSYLNEW